MSQHHKDPHPFYGTEIIRRNEQEYVLSLLKKYKNEPVDKEIKERSRMTYNGKI